MRLMSCLFVVSLLFFGCDDDGDNGADSSTVKDDSAGKDSNNSDSDTIPPKPGNCPSYLPKAADACPKDGDTCTYGDDPKCPATAICSAGKWTVTIAKCPGSATACPATFEQAAGKPCQTKDETCNYAGLRCACTNCIKWPVVTCQGPLEWKCTIPNPDPKCPYLQPHINTACPNEGQFCDYGCEHDVSRQCTGGKWVEASRPSGCPISTRKAKKDIRYLDGKHRAEMASGALSLRLATYRYRAPMLGHRTHLGFIIEDSPNSPAADMEKQQVDLYSYTSMVLALAQQQQKELRALRKEVERLRAKVAKSRR